MKYRNTSQYTILEQGIRFLAGQAHELKQKPSSPYLVEEKEAPKPKKAKE